MPLRSSRQSKPLATYNKRAIAYHATAITILWVVFLFTALAGWLCMLVYMLRLDSMERGLIVQQIQITNLEARVRSLTPVTKPVTSATTTPAVQPQTQPTTTAPVSALSPSGKLTRGSLSPDGTKYAGYEDTDKARLGIAVETIADGKIRHIVIFNPYNETSGNGTVLGSSMSVRWLDAKTIQYDVLIKRNGTEVKDTETVGIYF